MAFQNNQCRTVRLVCQGKTDHNIWFLEIGAWRIGVLMWLAKVRIRGLLTALILPGVGRLQAYRAGLFRAEPGPRRAHKLSELPAKVGLGMKGIVTELDVSRPTMGR